MLEFTRGIAENEDSLPKQVVSAATARVGIGEVMMTADVSFEELMAKVRAGDDAAESLVFRRYVRRLVGLASHHFDAWMLNRCDSEDVVLSACKSFFLRYREDAFDVADWDELWKLLAMITLRKCVNHRDYVRAGRRDVAREVGWSEVEGLGFRIPDRGPSAEEVTILAETVGQLLDATETRDRRIVESLLMGCTSEEIADQYDCSARTVRRVRQRAQQRLLLQLAS